MQGVKEYGAPRGTVQPGARKLAGSHRKGFRCWCLPIRIRDGRIDADEQRAACWIVACVVLHNFLHSMQESDTWLDLDERGHPRRITPEQREEGVVEVDPVPAGN